MLTHWDRVTHICASRLTITGSDNGLSPGRRQAIIWTNAGILLTGPLGTNFREILIEILTISFTKMHLKMSSAKWRPFCLGLNVLTWPDRNWWLCFCAPWWYHDMELLSALLALCEGNPPVTDWFPSQRGSNMEFWCFLNCPFDRTRCCTSSHVDGGLRCHDAH